MYTIQREVGRLDNLRVGLVGDLANGRTARSLAYLLSMYSGIKFYFVAPDVVRMQVCSHSILHTRTVQCHAVLHYAAHTLIDLAACSGRLPCDGSMQHIQPFVMTGIIWLGSHL